MVYFDFRTFFRLVYLSIFRWRDISPRLTFKLVIFFIRFFGVFPAISLFRAICFLFDEIFFGKYSKIEIKNPVFIVGNLRSGTTLIHRIMARDERQFFCFRVWEIIFPAIIQKKILSYMGFIDRLIGQIGSKFLVYFESRLVNNFNKLHPTSLFYPEEDGFLLLHIVSAPHIMLFFPFEEKDWLLRFDQLASHKDRNRIMTFYRNCIKRQAYFEGNKALLLSKNPGFSAKIDSLYEYFPGCKIIYMVRNPLEVIPSILSMASSVWHSNIDMEPSYLLQEKVYETAKYYYTYPLERLERRPKESYLVVNYEELVSQPSQVIKTIYQRFGFEITPEFLQALQEEDEKAKRYQSGHVYSLNQFRITREQIVSDLRTIFDRFHFDTKELTAQ